MCGSVCSCSLAYLTPTVLFTCKTPAHISRLWLDTVSTKKLSGIPGGRDAFHSTLPSSLTLKGSNYETCPRPKPAKSSLSQEPVSATIPGFLVVLRAICPGSPCPPHRFAVNIYYINQSHTASLTPKYCTHVGDDLSAAKRLLNTRPALRL